MNDGTATATPSGGASPYTYLWDTGETTPSVADLGTGWHYVTVTDDNDDKQVAFVEITLQEEPYDFNMTDSELGCFLQVASCKFGDAAQDLFDKNSMGIRDKCCENQLFLLHKNIETAACWHPQSIIDVEQPSYFVIEFESYSRNDCTLTIAILLKTFAFPFIAGNPLNVSLIALVDFINQNSTFKAQLDGNRVWIFAPSGYCGIPVTVSASSGDIVFNVLTTVGFQGGEKPCGSYVDWNGTYHEAPEDCLNQSQIGNIIDNIKESADCECMATQEIFNDDI